MNVKLDDYEVRVLINGLIQQLSPSRKNGHENSGKSGMNL